MTNTTKGYIAILSVLVISLLMLVLAIGLGVGSFFTRAGTADFFDKRASHFAAFSCLEFGRLQLSLNDNYGGSATTTINGQSCYLYAVETVGAVKILKSRAQVQGATTNLKLTVDAVNLSTVSLEEIVRF